LVANNQHPVQLNLYEFLNKKYREAKLKKDFEEGHGQVTYQIALDEKVKQLINERLAHKDVENGEDITPDDISEIYKEAVENVRESLKLSVKTRGKNGNIEDYLEKRRPFGFEENKI
jgi:hypothetical protein